MYTGLGIISCTSDEPGEQTYEGQKFQIPWIRARARLPI